MLRQKQSFTQIFKSVSDKYEQIQREYDIVQKQNDELEEMLENKGSKRKQSVVSKSSSSLEKKKSTAVAMIKSDPNAKPSLTGFLEHRFN